MIAFHLLLDWVLDGLTSEQSEQVDAHVLACDACAQIATRLWEIRDAIASATRQGQMFHISTSALIARMEAEGLDLCRYEIDPGGSVPCQATDSQHYAVARLNADLRGVQSLDLELVSEGAKPVAALQDVPFDPAAGVVYLAATGDMVRALPTGRLQVALFARDADGNRRPLASYTLDHHGLLPAGA